MVLIITLGFISLITLGFISIITLRFLYELGKSALKIDSKQNLTSIKEKPSYTIQLLGQVKFLQSN